MCIGLQVKYASFLSDFNIKWIFPTWLWNLVKFHEKNSVRAELSHEDRRADMTKLLTTILNFVKRLTSTYLHVGMKNKVNDKWQSKQLRNISPVVLIPFPLNGLSSRWPEVLDYAMDKSLSANAAPWHALYDCLCNDFYRRTKLYLSCLDILLQFQVST
jgi:hypothetical protein